MTEILYNYLRERFYKNNHDKYRKYFDEWINGITEIQMDYFEKERLNILHNSKIQQL